MSDLELTSDPLDVLIERGDTTLVDIVDHVLNRGVVLMADVTLALADVDLVRLRLWLILATADRFFAEAEEPSG